MNPNVAYREFYCPANTDPYDIDSQRYYCEEDAANAVARGLQWKWVDGDEVSDAIDWINLQEEKEALSFSSLCDEQWYFKTSDGHYHAIDVYSEELR